MYKKLVGILAACGIVTSLTQTVSVFAQSTASVNSSITSHILKQDTNFSVPFGLKQTEQLVNTVLQKQPYMNELLTGENFSSNGITTTVHVAWQQSTQQSSVLDAKIHTVLAKLIKPRMSDYDKEFVIHNWIVDHVSYDRSLTRYTPYDAMMDNSAVCQGIATLAYRMLTFAGIPTQLVVGTADGQSHLWNEVLVGGKWYQLDVTWDDPENKSPGEIDYNYYNETDAQFSVDHVWNHTGHPSAVTNFSSTVQSVLRSNRDVQMPQIAVATGVTAELDSPLVTAGTLGAEVQNEIDQNRTSFTVKYAGSTDAASQAMNQLNGLTGFTNLSYTVAPSRDSGYQIITVTVSY